MVFAQSVVNQSSTGKGSPNTANVSGDVSTTPKPTQAVDGSATPAPPILVIAKEDQYHGRALQAELTNIQVQINKMVEELKGNEKMKEMNDLRLSVCTMAKIAPDSCVVDFDSGKVSEKPKPVEKVPPSGSK